MRLPLSIKVATLFGIHFRVHTFFLLVLSLLAALGRLTEGLTVFGTVLLHEIAHVIVAKEHGLQVKEIELLPFGGVARIDEFLAMDPLVERSVAIAGPALNLFLAGLGWILIQYVMLPAAGLQFFITVNLILGGFNLLPALPLDGGRIYRARLVRLMGYRAATERATIMAKAIALILFVFGLAGVIIGSLSYTAMALALLIYFSAKEEQNVAMYVLMRYLHGKRTELHDAGWMEIEQLVAGPTVPVNEIVTRFVPQRYHVVWIVDDHGAILGVTTEVNILDALFESGIDTPLGSLVRTPD